MKILIRNSGLPLKTIIGTTKHQFKDGENDVPEEIAIHLLKYHVKHVISIDKIDIKKEVKAEEVKAAEPEIMEPIVNTNPTPEPKKEKGKPGRKPKK